MLFSFYFFIVVKDVKVSLNELFVRICRMHAERIGIVWLIRSRGIVVNIVVTRNVWIVVWRERQCKKSGSVVLNYSKRYVFDAVEWFYEIFMNYLNWNFKTPLNTFRYKKNTRQLKTYFYFAILLFLNARMTR